MLRKMDVDADYGIKTNKGINDDGSTRKKTKSWYKIHMVVNIISWETKDIKTLGYISNQSCD
jgi:hypothetical protein